MTFETKPSNQNFIIFLNKSQSTIIGYKRCDFFAILEIWLFVFNSYFSQYNSLCMRSISKRIDLQGCAQMGFLVVFIMALLISLVATGLLGSRKIVTLAHLAGATGLCKRCLSELFAPVSHQLRAALAGVNSPTHFPGKLEESLSRLL
uniref:Uncharacterized protein n=1 Tax=Equus caballus TaxID=9796 RepID=A0A3Q2HJH4_HORSE